MAEDWLASLALESEEEDAAPKGNARQERIAAAFASSKALYTAEHAVTEPGWFASEPPDGHILHYQIMSLYYSGDRAGCLVQCKRWAEDDIDPSVASNKELLDVALRVAAGDDLRRFIGMTWPVLKTAGNAGIAHTLATACCSAGMYRESVHASLYCLADRGLGNIPLRQLQTTLVAWQDACTDADQSAALQQLAHYFSDAELFKGSKRQPEAIQQAGQTLSDGADGATCAQIDNATVCDVLDLRDAAGHLGKITADVEKRRASRAQQDTAETSDGRQNPAGRSVRSL